MVKKKKAPFLKRLFPGSPVLRIIFVVVTLITAIVVVQNAYHYIRIRQQEAQLFQERDKLAKLEKKARDDLGLVKPGEVPYVR